MEINYKVTPRRFPYVEFKDKYNTVCSIQLSSGDPLDSLWIGVDDASPKIMAKDANKLGLIDDPELTGWVDYPVPQEVHFTTRMLLQREQIKAILPILQYFVETGFFPSDEEVEAMKDAS